jgi:hypothetical protein
MESRVEPCADFFPRRPLRVRFHVGQEDVGEPVLLAKAIVLHFGLRLTLPSHV